MINDKSDCDGRAAGHALATWKEGKEERHVEISLLSSASLKLDACFYALVE